ncbi:MAG: hypothetical protein WB821_08400 [Burkholderiaceae bacterium]
MDLRVPITISDELTDEVITAAGVLDLASGEISKVAYENYSAAADGFPWEHEDYEFTCGMLSNGGKDVEFTIQVNQTTGQYTVSATELLEIKVRAAALFSGVPSTTLLEEIAPKPKRRAP